MLVFSDQQLTYLATPKTGTTAIEMALRATAEISFGKRRKHMNAARFHGKVAPFLKKTFGIKTETVAVMRSPVDQIRSWYKYRARPEVDGSARSSADTSFDEFVLAVISDDPPEYAQIGSQYDFLTDDSGMVLVNHLFAYEDQDAFLSFLEKRLGKAIELKRKNVSPWLDAELSPDVEKKLRAARPEEFALYARLMAAGGYLHAPGLPTSPASDG